MAINYNMDEAPKDRTIMARWPEGGWWSTCWFKGTSVPQWSRGIIQDREQGIQPTCWVEHKDTDLDALLGYDPAKEMK